MTEMDPVHEAVRDAIIEKIDEEVRLLKYQAVIERQRTNDERAAQECDDVVVSLGLLKEYISKWRPGTRRAGSLTSSAS